MASTQRVALTCTLTYNNSGTTSPIANKQVTVVKRTGGAATVYNAVSGGAVVSTITTDVSGNLNGSVNQYFVAEGSYIIQVAGTGSYNAFNVYYEALHGDGVGNLDPSVGVLTGDVSGTLPATTVNTVLGGQTPVTDTTTLGGVLGGTFPNPTFSSTALQSLIPAGTIIESASAIPPAGFLSLNSGTASRTTYATLMAAITASKTVSFGSGVTTITIGDVTLEAFISGVLGASITTNYTYTTSIPVSGTGIGSSNMNTITGVEFTSGGSTILTLANSTTSIESNVSILIAPHGVGDGSTTFGLPTKNGRVGIGAGLSYATGSRYWSLGQAPISGPGGEETHVLSLEELPNPNITISGNTGNDSPDHMHPVYNSPSATGLYVATSTTGWGVISIQSGSGSSHNLPTSAALGNVDLATIETFSVTSSGRTNYHQHPFSGTTSLGGANAAHNNVQPVYVFNYYIKY